MGSTASFVHTRRPVGESCGETYVGGRILGPAVVIGDLVFFSTLETETYAARVSDGKVVWTIGLGKYSPGIATDTRYYLSLNGLLMAFDGRASGLDPDVGEECTMPTDQLSRTFAALADPTRRAISLACPTARRRSASSPSRST